MNTSTKDGAFIDSPGSANICGAGDLVGQDEVMQDKTGSNGSRKGMEVSLDCEGRNEAEDVSMDASGNFEDIPMHNTGANPTSVNTLVRGDLGGSRDGSGASKQEESTPSPVQGGFQAMSALGGQEGSVISTLVPDQDATGQVLSPIPANTPGDAQPITANIELNLVVLELGMFM